MTWRALERGLLLVPDRLSDPSEPTKRVKKGRNDTLGRGCDPPHLHQQNLLNRLISPTHS